LKVDSAKSRIEVKYERIAKGQSVSETQKTDVEEETEKQQEDRQSKQGSHSKLLNQLEQNSEQMTKPVKCNQLDEKTARRTRTGRAKSMA
jgi:hypothetical protein